MPMKTLFALGAVTCLLLISSPLSAHHGASAYDLTKSITARATVTNLQWENPHVILHFDVTDEKGVIRNWAVEMTNPLVMKRAGWNKDLLKSGDEITITFHPAKNGSATGYLREGSGKIMFQGKELGISGNAE
jgi:hypothetical protein